MTSSAIDGGTVLVTGASSGIGAAFAHAVAGRAKRLILVARREPRLRALAEELATARPSLETVVMACDLASSAGVDDLVARLRASGVEVDVLVNNAGIGTMGPFDRVDHDRTLEMIALNVTSLTMLTHALLPGMVLRDRGGVINVSSGFGLSFLPSFAAYCGTKHYVTGFTEALVADLAGTRVVASQVCPGPVATEFQAGLGVADGEIPRGILISARQCAEAAVRGFDRGRAMVVPGLLMKLVLVVNGLSPRFMRRLVASWLGRRLRRRVDRP